MRELQAEDAVAGLAAECVALSRRRRVSAVRITRASDAKEISQLPHERHAEGAWRRWKVHVVVCLRGAPARRR